MTRFLRFDERHNTPTLSVLHAEVVVVVVVVFVVIVIRVRVCFAVETNKSKTLLYWLAVI